MPDAALAPLPRAAEASAAGAALARTPGEASPAARLAGAGRDAAATAVVPGEAVTLLVVDLPPASRRAQAAAAPFAVEERLAEPLERMHVALGPEVDPDLAPGRRLVAAIARAAMAEHAAAAAPAARLVPDILGVPRPARAAAGAETEAGWTVHLDGGRALVRTAEGAGFAAEAPALSALWEAAGRPAFVALGDPPPAEMAAGARPDAPGATVPMADDAAALGLDLRQGDFARRSSGGPWRALAIAAGAAAALHLGLLALDAWSLGRTAEARAAELHAILDARGAAPGPGGDLTAAAVRALPSAGAPARGAFLPLLARAAAALGPFAEDLAFRELSWSAADGALAIGIETGDLSRLQRMEAALAEAGLAVQAGAATTGDGAARSRFTLRDPAGGPR